jgi:hypothetical protein
MRLLYLFTMVNAALIVSGCNYSMQNPPATVIRTQTTTIIPPCHKTHKNLQQISLMTKPVINRPYEVLGQATVSKFNAGGVKRQEATIRDLMREFAASMDGDALIDIKTDDNNISATVIAYKKVLA